VLLFSKSFLTSFLLPRLRPSSGSPAGIYIVFLLVIARRVWTRFNRVPGVRGRIRRAHHYNERRPHRALDRGTPGEAYRATLKALPAETRIQGHYRLRYDRLDPQGKMSLRRAGRMHHLRTGIANARKRVLALADDTQIIVTDLNDGEVLSTHQIDPTKSYWRNQNKEPGRWPSSPK
jgi:hypothetical protein